MRRIRRGGPYFRIADPAWADPLDPTYSLERGGRWNAPGAFPVLYVNRDLNTARANLGRKFAGLPYGPEMLNPDEAPVLIETTVDPADFVDALTDAGCIELGLPVSYPVDEHGRDVDWDRCRPIGLAAWQAGEAGIACRSAATPDRSGEEIALFRRAGHPALRVRRRLPFEEWSL